MVVRPTTLRAQLDRTQLADGAAMTFVASTEETNRYGFSLRNDGWNLDNFNANPVVLWMHDPFTPPLGRGQAVSDGSRVLLADVVFDDADPLAQSVERKLRRGFLNAVSVSWDYLSAEGEPVTDAWRLTNDQIRDELSYDLAEVSVVTVPGDPRAVRMAQARALAGAAGVALVREADHGDATVDELRTAVVDLAARLGLHLAAPAAPQTPAPAAPATPDVTAARTLLAALNIPEEGV